jgi:hypothetical protein
VEQRRQRVHVVALERVHVASQQRLLLLVHLLERGGVIDLACLQPGARSLQGAVDRLNRGLEQLRHLRCLPAEDLAEEQHRALAGREALQRGDERQADRLTGFDLLRRVGCCGDDVAVGDGLDPGDLRQRGRKRCVRRLGRTEVHGPGPALPCGEHIETHVRGDAVQPGAQRGAALEPLEAPPCTEEGLLHGILGLERRAQHPVGVAGQLGPVLFEQRLQLGGAAPRQGFLGWRDLGHAHDYMTGPRSQTHRPTDEFGRPRRS